MSQPRRSDPRHRVSPFSAGLQWATTITTIGLEMALPTLAGAWLDKRYDTSPIWTIVLALLGMTVAMKHLWDLSKRLGRRDGSSGSIAPGDRAPRS